MPQRPGHYALIHNDISAENFFYAPGEVQLFDFDQSCYGWSLQHLVNPIYPHYIFPAVSIPGARTADLALFFRPLVTGCRAEQPLSIEQLRLANALLQLKESFGYLILHVVRGINCAGGPFSTLGCCALESVSVPKAPFCNLGYDPRLLPPCRRVLSRGGRREFLRTTGLDRDARRGIALGCPVSPRIGAFFLTALEPQLERLGLFSVRYMDDILVLAPTRWTLRAVVKVVN
jgi:hypothetical protein